MNIRSPHLLALVLLSAVLLVGCATPARVDRMQVDSSLALRTTAAASPLNGKVAIKEVTGGTETNPAWMSKVSSGDFERALEASLRDAGLLSENRQAGSYMLTAHLQSLDQPFIGVSMTVTATVNYALVELATGTALYERVLATPYTAAWNAAFLGMERIKLANEGAMRVNISRLIADLIELKVPKPISTPTQPLKGSVVP